jgi:F-type H+-transporting ATPase subunit b
MTSTPEFWVLIAFVAFVALVYRKLSGVIGEALDKRAEDIRAEIESAAKLREDAQALLAEYTKKQRDALAEAEAILAAARDEARRVEAEAAQQLDARLKRREAQAMDKIAQAEAQALGEVRGAAVDLAVAATRKILAERVDTATGARLIEAAIADVPQRLRA